MRVFNENGQPVYRDYIPGETLPDGWSVDPLVVAFLFCKGGSRIHRVFNEHGQPVYRDYIPGEELPAGWSVEPFFQNKMIAKVSVKILVD